jgi:phosphate transport system protein
MATAQQHRRETLEKKIQALQDEVLILGSMVEQSILESVAALKNRDLKASKEIYARDAVINDKRFEIESETIRVIATQGPMAGDLRILAAIFEISSEMERMGDYAKGIARISIEIGETPLLKPLIDIPEMARITASMLNRALKAFVAADEKAARAIPQEDDRVDALYNQIHRELITFMISDPATIDQANYLLWVAHNLERLADRVTNICERTIFVATGELLELDVSDDESL